MQRSVILPRGNVIQSEKVTSFITNSRRSHALGLSPSCMISTTIRDKSLESFSSLVLESSSRYFTRIPYRYSHIACTRISTDRAPPHSIRTGTVPRVPKRAACPHTVFVLVLYLESFNIQSSSCQRPLRV